MIGIAIAALAFALAVALIATVLSARGMARQLGESLQATQRALGECVRDLRTVKLVERGARALDAAGLPPGAYPPNLELPPVSIAPPDPLHPLPGEEPDKFNQWQNTGERFAG